MPDYVKKTSLSAALIGLSAMVAPSAVAQDMQVPIQKCVAPAGTIAVHTPRLGVWRTVGTNDPSEFLMAIATESNCFTPAASLSSATYRIFAVPMSKSEFEADPERFTGSTALMSTQLRKPSKMVYAHVVIMDSSGHAVAQGNGRNNTSKLDYSQWNSANSGVLSYNSDKVSRKNGGAILNAFGDARAKIEKGLKGSGAQSSTQSQSNGSGSTPQSSTSASSSSGPALSLEEATEGLQGNSPAFAERFKTPQRVNMKRFYGGYVQRQVGKDIVYFNTSASSYDVDQTAMCFVNSSSPFLAQVVKLERGSPLIVEGTFKPVYPPAKEKMGVMFGFSYTYFDDNAVVVGIGADDCQMIGTWDPFDRKLVGGPTRSTKGLEDMFDERKANEFAFFRAYKDERVAISGSVSNIRETDEGEIRVTLRDPRTAGFGGQLTCALPSSQANRAAALSVGAKATIVGTIQKNDSYLPVPFDLVNCELP